MSKNYNKLLILNDMELVFSYPCTKKSQGILAVPGFPKRKESVDYYKNSFKS